MTAWGTTMYPTLTDPQPTAVTSGYAVLDYSGLVLAYAAVNATLTDPQPTSRALNYRIAFSVGARPTIGQLWPRGAGNRI